MTMLTSVLADRDAALADDAELRLIAEVAAAMDVEAAKTRRLIERLELCVAQGERMLADLGIAA
ncbi:MAG: hypothetical protein JO290_06500 [Sphingomonadaceae bacterium]|nr:hypothetical protein [Sphingomonadaceae bacterium]